MVELELIRKALPFATATHPEVGAERLCTVGRWRNHSGNLGFGIAVFLAFDLQVDDVAGHGIGHKHSQAVDLDYGFAFGGHVGDGYVFKQRKRFFLS